MPGFGMDSRRKFVRPSTAPRATTGPGVANTPRPGAGGAKTGGITDRPMKAKIPIRPRRFGGPSRHHKQPEMGGARPVGGGSGQPFTPWMPPGQQAGVQQMQIPQSQPTAYAYGELAGQLNPSYAGQYFTPNSNQGPIPLPQTQQMPIPPPPMAQPSPAMTLGEPPPMSQPQPAQQIQAQQMQPQPPMSVSPNPAFGYAPPPQMPQGYNPYPQQIPAPQFQYSTRRF